VDHGVECVIRDEGPGFTEEDKAKMFRRYGRLSARPTAGEPSTGLGLSIVRKLVQLMNGELTCESNEGQGTAFSFRLPRPAQNVKETGKK
jgi:two-component system sensor histidine kinase/response regulator